MADRIIRFDRRSSLASCRDFAGAGEDFVASGSDAYFDVVRALVDAGEPDGPAVFVDERGMSCMKVRSLHACARRYRPNADDLAAKRARIEAKRLERVG